MIRVAESEQEADEDDAAIGLRRVRVLDPLDDDPRRDGEEEQRDGVNLLVHHGLIPHRERRGANERRHAGHDQALPLLGNPTGDDSLGDQEPEAGRTGAGKRRHDVDSGCIRDRNRQRSERMAEQYEERITRRVGKAEEAARAPG